VIRATGFSPEMKEFRIRQFSRFVKKYSLEGKKIIEIGCGRGEYLSIMSQVGAETYGLEYSKDSVNQCIKSGLRAQAGFIENEKHKIRGAPFDAFFILNFFEHLPSPNDLLRVVSNNLKDDAVGIVEVPNFDMILKKKLFSEFTTDHLMYFTKDTLTTALALNGFDVLECNEVWHDYILSAVVKKRNMLDTAGFHKNQNRITKEAQEYVRQFKNGRLAVWGAGHQAFAAISLFGIARSVKYIVDSAPFKQGKYSPATHIPIVSPDKLNFDLVDAIIIMAGSYSDEIVKIIKERYGGRFNTAILRETGLEVLT
jgi:cyclopropane fatty-acyl-phospholipid synthase-like methyltransferase